MRADRTTAIAGALAINAVLLLALATLSNRKPAAPPPPISITLTGTVYSSTSSPSQPTGTTGSAKGTVYSSTTSGQAAPRTSAAEHRTSRRAAAKPDLEPGVLTGFDADGSGPGAGGNGNGNGAGNGHGRGIGLGDGGGVHAISDLPAPPPPPVSKARPAKLLHPTRQSEVDEAELFAAIVTVDVDGDVVGARMTRSHPGTRGDTADTMIWQFRYAPALDFDGAPIQSTFVQTFAVR